jgi:hypothetical protein
MRYAGEQPVEVAAGDQVAAIPIGQLLMKAGSAAIKLNQLDRARVFGSPTADSTVTGNTGNFSNGIDPTDVKPTYTNIPRIEGGFGNSIPGRILDAAVYGK